jgi:hypothetical protein
MIRVRIVTTASAAAAITSLRMSALGAQGLAGSDEFSLQRGEILIFRSVP